MMSISDLEKSGVTPWGRSRAAANKVIKDDLALLVAYICRLFHDHICLSPY